MDVATGGGGGGGGGGKSHNSHNFYVRMLVKITSKFGQIKIKSYFGLLQNIIKW